MNDPFVMEQARQWATQTLTESPDDRTRLQRMYLQAFTRPPTEEEWQLASRFLHERAGLNANEALTHLAHALLCSKEFIFVP